MDTLEELAIAGIIVTSLFAAQHEIRARQPIEHHATRIVERVERPVSDTAPLLLVLSGGRYRGENGETYCLRGAESAALDSTVRYDPIDGCYRVR